MAATSRHTGIMSFVRCREICSPHACPAGNVSSGEVGTAHTPHAGTNRLFTGRLLPREIFPETFFTVERKVPWVQEFTHSSGPKKLREWRRCLRQCLTYSICRRGKRECASRASNTRDPSHASASSMCSARSNCGAEIVATLWKDCQQ